MPRVLVVDHFDIVTIRRDKGNFLFLNVNFFGILGHFMGTIVDNHWTVDNRYFWDVVYRPQHLTVG